jgi:hypothetical protein
MRARKAALAGANGTAHSPAAGAFPRRYSDDQETGMLSPHELATLMLLKDSTDQIADREELDTLLERQLVALEQLAGGATRRHIMQDEDPPLWSFARAH